MNTYIALALIGYWSLLLVSRRTFGRLLYGNPEAYWTHPKSTQDRLDRRARTLAFGIILLWLIIVLFVSWIGVAKNWSQAMLFQLLGVFTIVAIALLGSLASPPELPLGMLERFIWFTEHKTGQLVGDEELWPEFLDWYERHLWFKNDKGKKDGD